MVKFAQLPKYEAYKDSGVEWLGDIPAEWSLIRLKNTMESCVNGLWGDDPKGKDEIVVLRVADFDYEKLSILDYKLTYRAIPEKDRQSRLLKNGDLLIEKSGGGDKTLVGRVVAFNKEYQALTSNFVAKISPQTWVDSSFLKYVFATLYSNNINYLSIKQTTGIQNLDTSSYFNEFFCFPIKSEQALIANYLDQKTAQIDAAIAIKEQQIELLKERKQIIIQQAVTQGLDPNVPMKDSGVEWIGQIPEHWEVLPLKRVALLSPSVAVENKKSKELVCFLPMEKVSVNGEVICDTFLPIKDVSQGFTVFNKNDVIVAKITPCFENGKSAYLDKLPTDVGYGSTEFHVLRCSNRISGRFLYLVVSSHLFLKAGEALMTGSAGQKRVPSSFITNFPIAIPSIAEQSKIIDTVDCQLLEINNVTNANFKQIQKLKEYKTTLINSAVTGKIKITPELLAK